jgi:hypothetical protein
MIGLSLGASGCASGCVNFLCGRLRFGIMLVKRKTCGSALILFD